MAVEVEYRFADGSPLLVRFEDEHQASRVWRLDPEHFPHRLTPMANALNELAWDGRRRAYEEVGLPVPPPWRPSPDANGFAYFDDGWFTDEETASLGRAVEALVDRYGSAASIWRERCLPLVREAMAIIDGASERDELAALAEAYGYGFHQTMIPGFVYRSDRTTLESIVAEVVGPDRAPLVASELVQGHANETLNADRELWVVAQAARRSPDLIEALCAEDPASAVERLRAGGDDHDEFFAAIDGFLERYGRRTEWWDIGAPTWVERQAGFWCQLRQLAADGVPDPGLVVDEAARRRAKRIDEIESAVRSSPEQLERFRRALDRLAPYVGVREERALWQLSLTGSLRLTLLRRGRQLVDLGVLDDPLDFLLLRPDETATSGHGPRAVVTARRTEHERLLAMRPPATIGGIVEPAPVPVLPRDHVLRGEAGSTGTARGRARIVTDLCDADRLEPGDVLVAVMTSPPWTPLFACAAAVVTDTGTLHSHPAIAAREYGIPCVLGTRIATAVIPDGAMVSVDGEQGTVTVEG